MKKPAYNRTDDSIFTLLSLFILIEQTIESLFESENILYSKFDKNNNTFSDLKNDTIREALIFQILLRICGFLEEWNNVFGVKTEPNHKEKILAVKKIAKPAFKQISKWKQLKDFRNEVIAHNHRDKAGNNIYLNAKNYHSPQTPSEIYLAGYCVKKLMDVTYFFFGDEVRYIKNRRVKKSDRLKGMSKFAVNKQIKILDFEINESIAKISEKEFIINALIDANKIK